MLNCLILPPNPNFDPPLSGVAAAGSKCTTLPGVISARLSWAGIGSGREISSSSRLSWRSAARASKSSRTCSSGAPASGSPSEGWPVPAGS
eukprot:3385915-Rhodomonas_salina.1